MIFSKITKVILMKEISTDIFALYYKDQCKNICFNKM